MKNDVKYLSISWQEILNLMQMYKIFLIYTKLQIEKKFNRETFF